MHHKVKFKNFPTRNNWLVGKILLVALAILFLGFSLAVNSEPANLAPGTGGNIHLEVAPGISEISFVDSSYGSNVNSFNGSNNLYLPFGSFNVGDINYDVGIAYNSNFWATSQVCDIIWTIGNPFENWIGDCGDLTHPDPDQSMAGAGWQLTVPRLYPPKDLSVYNSQGSPQPNMVWFPNLSTENWLLVDADGSKNAFTKQPELSTHEALWFSNGAEKSRLTVTNFATTPHQLITGETIQVITSTEVKVSTPNGNVMTFTKYTTDACRSHSNWVDIVANSGRYMETCWLISGIVDPAGESVSYNWAWDNTTDRFTSLTISDSYGRSHLINFFQPSNSIKNEPMGTRQIVDDITLFSNKTTAFKRKFDLVYWSDTSIPRRTPHNIAGVGDEFGTHVNTRFLKDVVLPDGTFHRFTYDTNADTSGAMKTHKMPAGGTVTYNFGDYTHPKSCDVYINNLYGTGGIGRYDDKQKISTRGVTSKVYTDPYDASQNGTTSYALTYDPTNYTGDPGATSCVRPKWFSNVVTYPANANGQYQKVTTYHSIATENSGNWRASEYGLPLFKDTSITSGHSGNKLYLSSEIRDCSGSTCSLAKTNYARYATRVVNQSACKEGDGNACARRDVVLEETYTVNHDGSTGKGVVYSGYDGLGHMRVATTYASGFSGSSSRTTTTTYNNSITSGSSSSSHVQVNDGYINFNSSFSGVLPANWITDLYDSISVTSDGNTHTTSYSWWDTGKVKCENLDNWSTQFTYHTTNGLVDSKTQSLSNCSAGSGKVVTNYDYDGAGVLTDVTVTGVTGALMDKEANAAGQITRSKTASGVETINVYASGSGRLTSSSTNGLSSTSFVYNSPGTSAGKVTATQSTSVSSVTYDGKGQPLSTSQSMTGGQTKVSSIDRDPLGNVVGLTVNGQSVASNDFDAQGRLTGSTNLFGTKTFNYTGDKKIDSTIDGHTTSVVLDGLGRVFSRKNPAGYCEYFTYNSFNQIKTITRAADTNACSTTAIPTSNVQKRSYTYDGKGRLTSETTPEVGTINYSNFDALGNPKTVDHPTHDVTLAYDNLGRLLSTTALPGNNVMAEFTYGGSACTNSGACTSNLTQSIRHNRIDGLDFPVQKDFIYHTAANGGQLSAVSHAVSYPDPNNVGGVLNKVFNQSYDYTSDFGQLKTLNYPDCDGCGLAADSSNDRSVTYGYDVGMLNSVTGGNQIDVNFVYNESGFMTALNYSGFSNLSTQFTPKSNNQVLDKIQVKSGSNVMWNYGSFTYDDRGNITNIATSSATRKNTYSYDGTSRLTASKTYSDIDPSWFTDHDVTYDVYDSITKVIRDPSDANAVSQSFTLNTKNQLTNAGFVYDSAGRMTDNGCYGFDYDQLGMVQKVTGNGNSGCSYSFTHLYDADNLRVMTSCVGCESNDLPDNLAPTASFTVSISGNTASFTDSSSDTDGNIVSWHWEYGDGQTDTFTSLEQPSHVYAVNGNYTARLTVTDDNGLTGISEANVNIGGGIEPPEDNSPPVAVFDWHAVDHNVTFIDLSYDPELEAITSWLWSFGDGSTSSEQNPSHSYAVAGDYGVSLLVFDTSNQLSTISTTVTVLDAGEGGGSSASDASLSVSISGIDVTNGIFDAGTRPYSTQDEVHLLTIRNDGGKPIEGLAMTSSNPDLVSVEAIFGGLIPGEEIIVALTLLPKLGPVNEQLTLTSNLTGSINIQVMADTTETQGAIIEFSVDGMVYREGELWQLPQQNLGDGDTDYAFEIKNVGKIDALTINNLHMTNSDYSLWDELAQNAIATTDAFNINVDESRRFTLKRHDNVGETTANLNFNSDAIGDDDNQFSVYVQGTGLDCRPKRWRVDLDECRVIDDDFELTRDGKNLARAQTENLIRSHDVLSFPKKLSSENSETYLRVFNNSEEVMTVIPEITGIGIDPSIHCFTADQSELVISPKSSKRLVLNASVSTGSFCEANLSLKMLLQSGKLMQPWLFLVSEFDHPTECTLNWQHPPLREECTQPVSSVLRFFGEGNENFPLVIDELINNQVIDFGTVTQGGLQKTFDVSVANSDSNGQNYFTQDAWHVNGRLNIDEEANISQYTPTNSGFVNGAGRGDNPKFISSAYAGRPWSGPYSTLGEVISNARMSKGSQEHEIKVWFKSFVKAPKHMTLNNREWTIYYRDHINLGSAPQTNDGQRIWTGISINNEGDEPLHIELSLSGGTNFNLTVEEGIPVEILPGESYKFRVLMNLQAVLGVHNAQLLITNDSGNAPQNYKLDFSGNVIAPGSSSLQIEQFPLGDESLKRTLAIGESTDWGAQAMLPGGRTTNVIRVSNISEATLSFAATASATAPDENLQIDNAATLPTEIAAGEFVDVQVSMPLDNEGSFASELEFFVGPEGTDPKSTDKDLNTEWFLVLANGTVTDSDPPVANGKIELTRPWHNGSHAGEVMAVTSNDVDENMETTTVTIATPPSGGSVVVNANRTVTYTPNEGFAPAPNETVIEDNFVYRLTDEFGQSDTAPVTVRVFNTAPVAYDDGALLFAPEGAAQLIDVTVNDTDANIDDSVRLLTSDCSGLTSGSLGKCFIKNIDEVTAAGFVIGNHIRAVDNSILVDPPASFLPGGGASSVSLDVHYWAGDGYGKTDSAKFAVRVGNNSPVAEDDAIFIRPNQTVTTNVLGNDYDGDGDIVRFDVDLIQNDADVAGWIITDAGNGALRIDPPSSFFPPANGEIISKEIIYRVTDGFAVSTGKLFVHVLNKAPEMTEATLSFSTVVQEEGVDIDLSPWIMDANGDNVSINSYIPGVGAVTVSGSSQKTFHYTPAAKFVGWDKITFILSDGFSLSQEMTLHIPISRSHGSCAPACRYLSGNWDGAADGAETMGAWVKDMADVGDPTTINALAFVTLDEHAQTFFPRITRFYPGVGIGINGKTEPTQADLQYMWDNYIPLAGDWDGDGLSNLGLYNKLTGKHYLLTQPNSVSGVIVELQSAQAGYGGAVDVDYLQAPIISDGDHEFLWQGDPNTLETVTPMVGDWQGLGCDTIGAYAKYNAGADREGFFQPAKYLFDCETGVPIYSLDSRGFLQYPDGAGGFKTYVDLERRVHFEGEMGVDYDPTMKPVAGDWNGNGIESIGIFLPNTFAATLHYTNSLTNPNLFEQQLDYLQGCVQPDTILAGDMRGNLDNGLGMLDEKHQIIMTGEACVWASPLTVTGNFGFSNFDIRTGTLAEPLKSEYEPNKNCGANGGTCLADAGGPVVQGGTIIVPAGSKGSVRFVDVEAVNGLSLPQTLQNGVIQPSGGTKFALSNHATVQNSQVDGGSGNKMRIYAHVDDGIEWGTVTPWPGYSINVRGQGTATAPQNPPSPFASCELLCVYLDSGNGYELLPSNQLKDLGIVGANATYPIAFVNGFENAMNWNFVSAASMRVKNAATSISTLTQNANSIAYRTLEVDWIESGSRTLEVKDANNILTSSRFNFYQQDPGVRTCSDFCVTVNDNEIATNVPLYSETGAQNTLMLTLENGTDSVREIGITFDNVIKQNSELFGFSESAPLCQTCTSLVEIVDYVPDQVVTVEAGSSLQLYFNYTHLAANAGQFTVVKPQFTMLNVRTISPQFYITNCSDDCVYHNGVKVAAGATIALGTSVIDVSMPTGLTILDVTDISGAATSYNATIGYSIKNENSFSKRLFATANAGSNLGTLTVGSSDYSLTIGGAIFMPKKLGNSWIFIKSEVSP